MITTTNVCGTMGAANALCDGDPVETYILLMAAATAAGHLIERTQAEMLENLETVSGQSKTMLNGIMDELGQPAPPHELEDGVTDG